MNKDEAVAMARRCVRHFARQMRMTLVTVANGKCMA